MRYGVTNFRVISINKGDFRQYALSREADKNGQQKNDFVCIQETHNLKDVEINHDKRTEVFSKSADGNSDNKGTGGVAIVVRNNILNTVTNVKRDSNRSTSMQIQTSNKTSIRIINTYAPHM